MARKFACSFGTRAKTLTLRPLSNHCTPVMYLAALLLPIPPTQNLSNELNSGRHNLMRRPRSRMSLLSLAPSSLTTICLLSNHWQSVSIPVSQFLSLKKPSKDSPSLQSPSTQKTRWPKKNLKLLHIISTKLQLLKFYRSQKRQKWIGSTRSFPITREEEEGLIDFLYHQSITVTS